MRAEKCIAILGLIFNVLGFCVFFFLGEGLCFSKGVFHFLLLNAICCGPHPEKKVERIPQLMKNSNLYGNTEI